MAKVRLGVIGCGGMGGAHMRGFDEEAARMTVAAAADISEERRRTVGELMPDAKVVSDYHDILDEVDAVLIALPHHLHHRATLDCLAAGKHVLLEKPMANTEQECLDIIEASERTDLTLMIGYPMRYIPGAVRMKELLEEKAYGECFQVSIWTEQHTERDPSDWICRAKTLGGGQFFSHGCHYVDVLLWYLGRPTRGVHIGTNYGTPWMEKEGTSNVTIAFESGALGYHFGTWGAKGTRLGYSFHAHCTEGMLEWAYGQGKLFAHVKGREKLLFEHKTGKHTARELGHFLDCMATGRKPITDARSSLQGLRLIWRLYEAEQNNTIADLRGLGLDEA